MSVCHGRSSVNANTDGRPQQIRGGAHSFRWTPVQSTEIDLLQWTRTAPVLVANAHKYTQQNHIVDHHVTCQNTTLPLLYNSLALEACKKSQLLVESLPNSTVKFNYYCQDLFWAFEISRMKGWHSDCERLHRRRPPSTSESSQSVAIQECHRRLYDAWQQLTPNS